MIKIVTDDLTGGAVIKLLQEHLADMHATSPAESVHALDIEALKAPEITFYSAWREQELMGCAALKTLTATQAELKSMRTTREARNQGVATALLEHVVAVARDRGCMVLNLETGTQEFFLPAYRLYKKFGFTERAPFADYQEDPNSVFMSLKL